MATNKYLKRLVYIAITMIAIGVAVLAFVPYVVFHHVVLECPQLGERDFAVIEKSFDIKLSREIAIERCAICCARDRTAICLLKIPSKSLRGFLQVNHIGDTPGRFEYLAAELECAHWNTLSRKEDCEMIVRRQRYSHLAVMRENSSFHEIVLVVSDADGAFNLRDLHDFLVVHAGTFKR
jgi:hypothetical protein